MTIVNRCVNDALQHAKQAKNINHDCFNLMHISSDNNHPIADNLKQITEEITDLATQYGNTPEALKLIAVSKTRPCEDILAARQAGQIRFGENKVQELSDKKTQIKTDCDWHFIGHLQRNKVRIAVDCAQWIHSVDSLRLLQRLVDITEGVTAPPNILLQVNVSGETSKHGFTPENVKEGLDLLMKAEHLICKGFMTMAPFTEDIREQRKVFAGLRVLRDNLQQEYGISLPELSMGMSNDYEAAIAEGATFLRIGSAIFGPRT